MMAAPAGPDADRPLTQDEPALLARCRDGDTAAYAVLVTRYRERAYGLALRLVRSAPDAEEAAQDAFVSAWRSIGSFREDAAFSTWLYRIVYRKALDRAASLKRRGKHEVAVEDPASVEGPETTAAAAPPETGGGDAARLERLMAGLSDAARAVVTLFYYKDLSVAEVGEALGLPEGTVKTHLHRARAALREGWWRETGEVDRDL